ncbi:UDP-glucose 4-epimerase GalE [Pontimonas sp.]|nr:UDP-glucose 4-epimerase GalE [Pontimonas sp.]
MTWMVTGGAGYIGSHIVRNFLESGIPVVVLDNFSTGVRGFVPPSVPLVELDLLDASGVHAALIDHAVTGVVHVAGFKFAGISVEKPLHAYEQNVVATMALLEAMNLAEVSKIVFSSSSSVYGNTASGLVSESQPFSPTSPYGESKVVAEWLLRNQGFAHGLVHTSLRYFNVVGSASDDLPDVSPHNLLSMAFAALETGNTPQIFGDDYDTPDGTCIRDYIHVADLAKAHVSAAKRMDEGQSIERAYNLGGGTGTSVLEMMTAISEVTGIAFTPEVSPRRAGDPARVVASGDLASRDLGWAMGHSLEEMIGSAWSARKSVQTI